MRPLVAALALVALARPAGATALLVCAAPSGLVVSADGKGTWVTREGETTDADKLALVGDHVVVAEAGLLRLQSKAGVVFDVGAFVAQATRALGPGPRVHAVAIALAEAAGGLASLGTHPAVRRASNPEITLVVAGWEGAPVVERVRVGLLPFSVERTRERDPFVEVGFGPGHLRPDGAVWLAAKRRLPWLGARAATSTAELADACGLVLALELPLNPSAGPPIRQAILSRAGVRRRVYAGR